MNDIKIVFFDFDGVFTDNKVIVSEDGKENVRCCRADGVGLQELKKNGIELAIVSAEINSVVEVRSRKLNIKYVYSGVVDKLSKVKELLSKLELTPNRAAFVGNDTADIEAMNYVKYSFCPPDAEQEVLEIVKYRANRKGGEGCVRDVCNMILKEL